MENKPTISWAITCWNEHEELKRLLEQLTSKVPSSDEIVIQGDQGKVTSQVSSVISNFLFKYDNITYIEYPLNKDFGTYKNNLFKNCTKDYIFQVDADEFLAGPLIGLVHDLLASEPDVDLFWIPRLNIVSGIKPEYAVEQGWRLESVGEFSDVVNWGLDYQGRLCKSNLRWEGKVHERLTGATTMAQLPYEMEYCLYHPKTIGRQKSQNEFYKNI